MPEAPWDMVIGGSDCHFLTVLLQWKIASLQCACRGNEKKPRRIAALKGVNIVQAACGGWHCLAVSNAGQAYAWGGNEYGQCGVAQGKRDVPEPTPCLSEHKVVQVAAGGMHTCALTESGQVGTLVCIAASCPVPYVPCYCGFPDFVCCAWVSLPIRSSLDSYMHFLPCCSMVEDPSAWHACNYRTLMLYSYHRHAALQRILPAFVACLYEIKSVLNESVLARYGHGVSHGESSLCSLTALHVLYLMPLMSQRLPAARFIT